DVDLLAAEHGLDARTEVALLGQGEQERQGFVSDAVLRIVEVQPHRLGGQPLAARGVGGEQIAQLQVARLLVVGGEGFPCRGPLECLSLDCHPGAPPLETSIVDAPLPPWKESRASASATCESRRGTRWHSRPRGNAAAGPSATWRCRRRGPPRRARAR